MEERAHDADTAQLAQLGYRQELHRTLGSFSAFAAGFSYISILTGMFQTSYLGFLFAGPAFSWTWLVVLFGQFMVALQFAELAAHYPLAGSVYQWAKRLSPNRGWAWGTGWTYLAAQILTIPAVALGWQVILPQIWSGFQFVGPPEAAYTFDHPDFAKNAIILGVIMIGLTTLINIAGVRVLSKVNNIGVAAELLGALALIVVYMVHITRGPGTVLTDTTLPGSDPPVSAGVGHQWGYLGALLIGAIMPLYVMYGFDTAGSLAEETSAPQKKAPPAILRALATAGIMGFLLILFGTMAMPDDQYPNGLAGGLTAITFSVLGEVPAKILLAVVVVAIFVCCLAIHAMSVRILFAMGRDGNLPFPRALSSVSRRRKVPVIPALFAGGLGIAILALNLGNPYVFTIIISMGIILMYLSYAGVTIPLFSRRMKGWPSREEGAGLFGLGSFGVISCGIAIVYGLLMTVNLLWPRSAFYGPRWYQQWGVVIVLAIVWGLGLALYWGYVRKHGGRVLEEHRADVALAEQAEG